MKAHIEAFENAIKQIQAFQFIETYTYQKLMQNSRDFNALCQQVQANQAFSQAREALRTAMQRYRALQGEEIILHDTEIKFQKALTEKKTEMQKHIKACYARIKELETTLNAALTTFQETISFDPIIQANTTSQLETQAREFWKLLHQFEKNPIYLTAKENLPPEHVFFEKYNAWIANQEGRYVELYRKKERELSSTPSPIIAPVPLETKPVPLPQADPQATSTTNEQLIQILEKHHFYRSWSELINKIADLKKKSDPSSQHRANIAIQLNEELGKIYQQLLAGTEHLALRLHNFTKNCHDLLNPAKNTYLKPLTKFKDWKQCIANVTAAVLSIATVGLFAPIAYKLGMFSRTTATMKKVEALTASVNSISL